MGVVGTTLGKSYGANGLGSPPSVALIPLVLLVSGWRVADANLNACKRAVVQHQRTADYPGWAHGRRHCFQGGY